MIPWTLLLYVAGLFALFVTVNASIVFFYVFMPIGLNVLIKTLTRKGKYKQANRWSLFLLKWLEDKNSKSSSLAFGLSPLFLMHILSMMRRLSEVAERQADWEKAISWAMRQTEARFPTNDRILGYHRTAQLLYQLGRVEEAQEKEAEALALEPVSKISENPESDIKPPSNARQGRIAVLMDQGKLLEVLELLAQDEDMNTPDKKWLPLLSQAGVLRQCGRYEEAIAMQHQAMEQYHKHPPSYGVVINTLLQKTHQVMEQQFALILIEISLEKGDIGGAAEYWEQISESIQDKDLAQFSSAVGAWVAAAQGNGEESRRLLQETESRESSKAILAAQISDAVVRAQLALHEYESAVQQLQKLIAKNSAKPLRQAEHRTLLGQCYQGLEKTEAAIKEYELVVAAGYEEAEFTRIARVQLARLKANSTITDASWNREQVSIGR